MKAKRELGMFFSSTVRLREDLTELRHPQAENSVLFSALPARSRSLSMISLRPPIRWRRFLFSRSRSKPRSISSRSSSSRPAMRRVLAGPLGGRPLAIRAAARQGASSSAHQRASPGAMPHAPEGRRGSHLFEQLRRFEIIKARRRENESSGSFFFQVPTVYHQQRLSSAGAGPRGGGPARNSITRSKGAEPGGA